MDVGVAAASQALSGLDDALLTLERAALSPDNQRGLWLSAEVRATIVCAAAASHDEAMRARAITTLCSLSSNFTNRREMWEHAGARAALIEAAAADVADAVRASAVTALCNLAYWVANRVEMWEHIGARTALIAAAVDGGAEAAMLRGSAVKALHRLTRADANRREMWEHAGVRAALLADGRAEAARESAVHALANLALLRENQREMWADEEGTRRVLMAAATAADGCPNMRDAARLTLESLVPELDRVEIVKFAMASHAAGSAQAQHAATLVEQIDISGAGEPVVARVERVPATLGGTGKRGAEGAVPAGEFKRVKREIDGKTDALDCVVCTDARRDTLLLPCRHLVVCGSCCARLPREECPICRTIVEETVRVIAC